MSSEGEKENIPSEEPQKIRHGMLRIISEWTSSSSSHGLPNILATKSIVLKVIWGIATFLSYGFCIFLVIYTLLEYLEYETVSSIKQINEAPTDFPAVDICNLNPYDGEKIGDWDISEDEVLNYSGDGKFLADEKLNEILIYYKRIENKINLTELGYSLSSMLKSCRFQGKSCNQSHFVRYHNFYYGNCYSFNSGFDSNGNRVEIKKTTKPGWRNGLQLELDIGPINSLKFSYRSGFRILIHNQSFKAYPEEEGISVESGTETSIGISKTIFKKISEPYSDCIGKLNPDNLNNEFLKAMFLQHKVVNYEQKLCQKICLQHFIIQKCNCYDFSLPMISEKYMSIGCWNSSLIKCNNLAEKEFFNSDAITSCYKKCPIECEKSVYSTQIYMANFPTKWYLEKFYPKKTETYNDYFDFISNQYDQTKLLVNIYFDDLSYTLMSESKAVTIDSLLGNIGGHLGLFIGISVLSCIENIELMVLLILYVLKKKK